MKTEGRRQSENVEDRRGQGGRFPGGRVGAGGGVGLIVVVILALVFGVDPSQLISGMEGAGAPGVEQPSEARAGMERTCTTRDGRSLAPRDKERPTNHRALCARMPGLNSP